jgi:hypothetical protein
MIMTRLSLHFGCLARNSVSDVQVGRQAVGAQRGEEGSGFAKMRTCRVALLIWKAWSTIHPKALAVSPRAPILWLLTVQDCSNPPQKTKLEDENGNLHQRCCCLTLNLRRSPKMPDTMCLKVWSLVIRKRREEGEVSRNLKQAGDKEERRSGWIFIRARGAWVLVLA